MANDLNVLIDYPYPKRYYLTHPWKFFKDFWINFKNGWYRATKGYGYTDLWNIDNWLLTVLPAMLRELAERHNAYPGQPPFETSEKWEAWLIDMAERLEYLQEDDDEKENEYAKAFYSEMDLRRRVTDNGNMLTITYTSNDEEFEQLRQNYFRRCREIVEKKRKLAKEVGEELFGYLHCLWD